MNEPNRKIKTHNSFISVWQQHNLKVSIKISSVRKATKKAVLYQSASVCLNPSIRSETRTKQKTRKKWERSKNQHQRKRKTFRVWRERSKVIFSFLKSKHTNILHTHEQWKKRDAVLSADCGDTRRSHKTFLDPETLFDHQYAQTCIMYKQYGMLPDMPIFQWLHCICVWMPMSYFVTVCVRVFFIRFLLFKWIFSTLCRARNSILSRFLYLALSYPFACRRRILFANLRKTNRFFLYAAVFILFSIFENIWMQ